MGPDTPDRWWVEEEETAQRGSFWKSTGRRRLPFPKLGVGRTIRNLWPTRAALAELSVTGSGKTEIAGGALSRMEPMKSWWSRGPAVVLAVGLFAATAPAGAQALRSDTEIVGPGGRAVERHVEARRGRAGVHRETRVLRPGGLADRQVEIRRQPGGIERDVRIQGPGGATFERDVRIERGRGQAGREIRIQRPGGATFERRVEVQRGPGFAGRGVRIQRPGGARYDRYVEVQRFGGGYVPAPPVVFPRGPVFRRPRVIERDVFIQPAPAVAVAAPFFSFFMGGPPVPPPVIVEERPVYVQPAPPPTVIVREPQPYQPPPPPETVVVDPVGEQIARLASDHDDSREDASRILGRMGDPRAVPALADRLKHDEDEDVREAAAWALGAIGDPQAATFVYRSSIYDKKRQVREAAAQSYQRLAAASQAQAATAPASPEVEYGPAEVVPPPPQPAGDNLPPALTLPGFGDDD